MGQNQQPDLYLFLFPSPSASPSLFLSLGEYVYIERRTALSSSSAARRTLASAERVPTMRLLMPSAFMVLDVSMGGHQTGDARVLADSNSKQRVGVAEDRLAAVLLVREGGGRWSVGGVDVGKKGPSPVCSSKQ